MPMYEIPRVKDVEASPSTKEKEVPKISISIPTPSTTQTLLALLTELLTTHKVTYIRIYPDSMNYEYVAPPPVEEVLKWYREQRDKSE